MRMYKDVPIAEKTRKRKLYLNLIFYKSLKYLFYKKITTLRMSFLQEYKKYILYIFFYYKTPFNIIIKNIFMINKRICDNFMYIFDNL